MNYTRLDRVARGVLLSAQGHVAQLGPDQWAVRSASDQATTYNVTPQACDCPDSKRGQSICKHQWASCGYVAAFIILALRKAVSISIANRILEPASAIIASLPTGYRRTIGDEYSQAVKRISSTAKNPESSSEITSGAKVDRPSPQMTVQASAPIYFHKECTHDACKTTRCDRSQSIGGIQV